MNTIIKTPSKCSKQELESFETLVRKGEEVATDGLSERISNAALLMFLTGADGSLIGVSALKRPNLKYRAKVFKNANSKLQPEDFSLELGWIFVVESERSKKHSHTLVEQLLPYASTERIYATTRECNPRMIKTNERYGFRRDGIAYPSENGHHNLLLFVR
ncbi:MAG TPA: GNAT family protein [Verrucomicrobiae bacterium]